MIVARERQWRIVVKCDEPDNKIDYEEPFVGLSADAMRRARIMWARTSYVANVKERTSNRDVYAKLEVWDRESFVWRLVWERRGKYPLGKPAPGQT
jgi:hypothetical protein